MNSKYLADIISVIRTYHYFYFPDESKSLIFTLILKFWYNPTPMKKYIDKKVRKTAFVLGMSLPASLLINT